MELRPSVQEAGTVTIWLCCKMVSGRTYKVWMQYFWVILCERQNRQTRGSEGETDRQTDQRTKKRSDQKPKFCDFVTYIKMTLNYLNGYLSHENLVHRMADVSAMELTKTKYARTLWCSFSKWLDAALFTFLFNFVEWTIFVCRLNTVCEKLQETQIKLARHVVVN